MPKQIDTDPYKGLIDSSTHMKYKDSKSGFKRGSIFKNSPVITILLLLAFVGGTKAAIDNITGAFNVSTSTTFAANDPSSLKKITDKISDLTSTQVAGKFWIWTGLKDSARRGLAQLLPQRYNLLTLAAKTDPSRITKDALLSASEIASLPENLRDKTGQNTERLVGTILYNEQFTFFGSDDFNLLYKFLISDTDGNVDPAYINTDNAKELVNSTVEIESAGVINTGSGYIIPDSNALQILTGATTMGSSSNVTLTVVLINGGTVAPKLTQSQVQSFFGAISGFYSAASYGKMTLNTPVTAWTHIPTDGLSCSNPTSGLEWGDRARTALGLPNPGNNNFYAYIIVPGSVSCGMQGFDLPNAGAFWMLQSPDITTLNQQQSVYVHELGHLIGLLHEGRGSCPSGSQSCASGYQEYAEDTDGDPMGRKNAAGLATDFSNIHKEIKEWLGNSNIQTVSGAGGIYSINAISGSSGIIDVTYGNYHLEYRPSSGIKVRTTRTPGAVYADSTIVSTLASGGVFQDGSLSVKFCGASGSTTASVDVRIGGGSHTCIGAATTPPPTTSTPTATSTVTTNPSPTPPPDDCNFIEDIYNFITGGTCEPAPSPNPAPSPIPAQSMPPTGSGNLSCSPAQINYITNSLIPTVTGSWIVLPPGYIPEPFAVTTVTSNTTGPVTLDVSIVHYSGTAFELISNTAGLTAGTNVILFKPLPMGGVHPNYGGVINITAKNSSRATIGQCSVQAYGTPISSNSPGGVSITLNPNQITIPVGGQGTVTISGGQPPYFFTKVSNGNVIRSTTFDSSIDYRSAVDGSVPLAHITGRIEGSTVILRAETDSVGIPESGVVEVGDSYPAGYSGYRWNHIGVNVISAVDSGNPSPAPGITPTPVPTQNSGANPTPTQAAGSTTPIPVSPGPTDEANCDTDNSGSFNFEICFSATAITATVSNLGQNSIRIKMDGDVKGSCPTGQTTCTIPVNVIAGSGHNMTAQIKDSNNTTIAAFGTQLNAGPIPDYGGGGSCSWWEIWCPFLQ